MCGDKNYKLVYFSALISEYAGQLLTIMIFFYPCLSNLLSSSRSDSAKTLEMLEISWFGRLTNYNHWDFLSKSFICIHSSDSLFAMFSTWLMLPFKMLNFSIRKADQNHLHFRRHIFDTYTILSVEQSLARTL